MPWQQHGVVSTFLSPYILSNTLSPSEGNAVSALCILVGLAAMQHKGVTEVLYTERYSLHPRGGSSEKFSCWNKWIILQYHHQIERSEKIMHGKYIYSKNKSRGKVCHSCCAVIDIKWHKNHIQMYKNIS